MRTMKDDRPTDEILAEGNYYRMRLRDGRWEYLQPKNFSGVVMMVAVTDEKEMIFIEQHRIPVDRVCVEIPAGLVGDEDHLRDEAMSDAARRELLEETGYYAEQVDYLGCGAPSAGSNSLILSFYGCTGLRKVADGGGVDDEDIRVFKIPLSQAADFLERRQAVGSIVDLKVYSGLFYAHQLVDRKEGK